MSGKTGVVIQDCEINGLSAEGVHGISGQGTFLRDNIHHTVARTMMESRQTGLFPILPFGTTRSLTRTTRHRR